jgi:hypothetical protein
MPANNKYIRYFKNPLYGISAFSSYGLPNSLVHLPLMLMITYGGILICGAEARMLLPVYFIVALYVSRDLVIASYNKLYIPIGLWVILIFFLIFKKETAHLLTFHSFQHSTSVTAGILLAFLVYIMLRIK